MRTPSAVAALLLCTACSTAPTWSPIPKPWTREVVDVQRRVRVVPTQGTSFEVEEPRLEPDGRPVLAWQGTGPSERYPDKFLPIDEVVSILGITPGDPNYGGQRLAQAGLVAAGVILWALILVAIFA